MAQIFIFIRHFAGFISQPVFTELLVKTRLQFIQDRHRRNYDLLTQCLVNQLPHIRAIATLRSSLRYEARAV